MPTAVIMATVADPWAMRTIDVMKKAASSRESPPCPTGISLLQWHRQYRFVAGRAQMRPPRP